MRILLLNPSLYSNGFKADYFNYHIKTFSPLYTLGTVSSKDLIGKGSQADFSIHLSFKGQMTSYYYMPIS